jgi:zinc protease
MFRYGVAAAMSCLLGGQAAVVAASADYAVVVSQATYDDAEWRPVVDALVEKHKAAIIRYPSGVGDAADELRKLFPRWICFVAKPSEAGRQFVANVHRLTRRLDDDIYTDAQWGILTGYNAANALRIARQSEPLEVRKVASATEIELDLCREGTWYSELKQNQRVRKDPGGKPVEGKGPDDTTAALADCLNRDHADLFVTSGHATERDWQIGYRYRNGMFQSKAGKLFGVDTAGTRIDIQSPDPKVYLPIGNCLMGHIDGPDAMALAWMNSAGVMQMIGYTVPSWYGYGGWGMLDYFLEQPGRYTMSEAFFVNQQALLHRLEANFPGLAASGEPEPRIQATETSRANGLTAQDAQGLLYDRDTVAFYGDPAWQARMAAAQCAFDQRFEVKDGKYTLDIQPQNANAFKPVNTNGSQRGGRPIVQLLPDRIDIKSIRVTSGAELHPTITDNFILIPLPTECDPNQNYRVVFQANQLPR